VFLPLKGIFNTHILYHGYLSIFYYRFADIFDNV
jgi:hypothetical protein